MASIEGDRTGSAGRSASLGDCAVNGDDAQHIAASIAQKLREAFLKCEIVNLFPVEAAVLRRDRTIVILALTLLSALAWSYMLWLSAGMTMGGMDMTGLRIIPSGTALMVPAEQPWRGVEFVFVFAMWTVMMVGMMAPSAAPMVLIYARIGRQTEPHEAPFTATVWFAFGYFLVWTAFALLATLMHWAFERTALLDYAMAGTSNIVGGLLLVAAGSYQWTRVEDLCLVQCQKPFAFLMRNGGFRSGASGSLMLGLRHGAYCVGCCWALMAVLLMAGVMSPLWIAVLALLILLEKVTPFGRRIASVAGMVLVAAGAWTLSAAMS
jgi:predicted metal-binding membrane protein